MDFKIDVLMSTGLEDFFELSPAISENILLGLVSSNTTVSGISCFFVFFYLVSCIFILLSPESDQCAIRARLGVANPLSTTPRWGNPAKCLSQRHNE